MFQRCKKGIKDLKKYGVKKIIILMAPDIAYYIITHRKSILNDATIIIDKRIKKGFIYIMDADIFDFYNPFKK